MSRFLNLVMTPKGGIRSRKNKNPKKVPDQDAVIARYKDKEKEEKSRIYV